MTRCTDCSSPIIPVVAVDIDGTIGQYHEHFRWFAEQFSGRSLGPDATASYDYQAEFSEWLGMTKEEYREAKLAYRQGGMKRSMPPEPGGRGLLSHLRRWGAEIWLTTTRPWQSLDNIDRDTREWLRRNQMTYDHLVFGDDKYEQLTTRLDQDRIVFVIDDLPEQVLAAHEARLPIVHYTARCDRFVTVSSIPKAEDHSKTKKILDEWMFLWRSSATNS